METTSVERLRDEAVRFLRRFGLVAAVWSTLLAGSAPTVDRRGVLWVGIGVLWVWAVGSQRVTDPRAWWWGWLVVASLLELLGPAAGTAGWSVAGGASFIVLAGVALTGRRSWVVGTVVWLSLVAVARGVVATGWNVGGGVGTVLIFAFGGLALTWLVRTIQRTLEERDRLQTALVAAETAAARSSERAEASARLHDTVLQHLTAVGRADELATARQHAGRASNELRAFLRTPQQTTDRLRAALEQTVTRAADGREVSVGVVGDTTVGARERLLLDATGEAVRNAATHTTAPVRVFAEVGADTGLVVWVRDQGGGFDPTAVPPDRLGVRESILGRMQRAKGSAQVRTGPDGTEWELRLPPDDAPREDPA
jgi:signal transduction histidine kinase